MILKADQIVRELEKPEDEDDPLIITPRPNLDDLRASGAASLDVRLGRWFLVCRPSRTRLLDVYDKNTPLPNESRLTKTHYVPFGKEFILHPRTFVLGITIEWLRLPSNRGAYVIGKSSWGRHGLIIATATGVHPGFTGCLTLELSNIAEVPIIIRPGTCICQIFIHKVESGAKDRIDQSSFVGRRMPTLGMIKLDQISEDLAELKPPS